MGEWEKMTQKVMRETGFPFGFDSGACEYCDSRCCRGRSGNVWVNAREMDAICRFSGVNIIDGLETCFVKRHNRFSIREKMVDGEWHCLFLDSRLKCSIYPVRPLQCRQFPFWPRFKTDPRGLKQECPGLIFALDPVSAQNTMS